MFNVCIFLSYFRNNRLFTEYVVLCFLKTFFFSISQVFFCFFLIEVPERLSLHKSLHRKRERERFFSSLTYNGGKLKSVQQSPPKSAWVNLQRKAVPQIHTLTPRRTKKNFVTVTSTVCLCQVAAVSSQSQQDVFDCWRSPALAQRARLHLNLDTKGLQHQFFRTEGLPLNASFEFFQGAKED